MEHLTIDQFTQKYGGATERRVELCERLRQWLTTAQSLQVLRRLLVFGSLASDKSGPGDIDLLAVFVSGFDLDKLPADSRHWFDHELCRALHNIDLFSATEDTTPTILDFLIEGFRYNRAGKETMVEILL